MCEKAGRRGIFSRSVRWISPDEHCCGSFGGRRFYAVATIPIYGPLTGTIFATRALSADYSISNKTRFEAVLAWDVLSSLRQTGVF